jgi:hypothetical protein
MTETLGRERCESASSYTLHARACVSTYGSPFTSFTSKRDPTRWWGRRAAKILIDRGERRCGLDRERLRLFVEKQSGDFKP